MNEDTLTLELLKQLKSHSKRWFIAFLIAICMFFISNLAWLYAWNLPAEEKEVSATYDYDVDSEDNGNAIINDDGKVEVNGESEKEDSN